MGVIHHGRRGHANAPFSVAGEATNGTACHTDCPWRYRWRRTFITEKLLAVSWLGPGFELKGITTAKIETKNLLRQLYLEQKRPTTLPLRLPDFSKPREATITGRPCQDQQSIPTVNTSKIFDRYFDAPIHGRAWIPPQAAGSL